MSMHHLAEHLDADNHRYRSNSPLELGVQFRSDSSGYITGIRFYKSAANTGTHIGNLWNGLGTLLASATFTGESASGWSR